MAEPEPVDEVTEQQEQEQLRRPYNQSRQQLPTQQRRGRHWRDRQPRTRAPHFLLAQRERDAENQSEQDEHQTEARDILLERGERDVVAGDVMLLDVQQFLAERIAERRRLAIGQQHHHFDRLELAPLRWIGEHFHSGGLLREVTLAQLGRQDQRGRSVVSLGHQILRRRAGNPPYVKMLAKGADQRGRDWPLILINDGEQDALAAVAGLSGSGDDHYHDDRHDQQRDQAVTVAADEPEILQHHGDSLHDCAASLALPYFRRIRVSRSSTLMRESRSLS